MKLDPAAPQGEDPRVPADPVQYWREKWETLRRENAKLREALTKIAMVCCMNAYAVDKDFWCKPEEGKHSCYCAEGMARAALDPSSTGTS